MTDPRGLPELLEAHRADLIAFVRRHGARLLEFESEEDLAQGLVYRALASADSFEQRSEAEFFGWIYTLARRQIADRVDYWTAKKRGAARVLRLTWHDTDDPNAAAPPASGGSGPMTVAMRRELLQLALECLAAMPERDRKLVRWASESVGVGEQAARLGLSEAATQRAGHRAMERYRKTFALAQRRGEG